MARYDLWVNSRVADLQMIMDVAIAQDSVTNLLLSNAGGTYVRLSLP
jgi:hypothetical protein